MVLHGRRSGDAFTIDGAVLQREVSRQGSYFNHSLSGTACRSGQFMVPV